MADYGQRQQRNGNVRKVAPTSPSAAYPKQPSPDVAAAFTRAAAANEAHQRQARSWLEHDVVRPPSGDRQMSAQGDPGHPRDGDAVFGVGDFPGAAPPGQPLPVEQSRLSGRPLGGAGWPAPRITSPDGHLVLREGSSGAALYAQMTAQQAGALAPQMLHQQMASDAATRQPGAVYVGPERKPGLIAKLLGWLRGRAG